MKLYIILFACFALSFTFSPELFANPLDSIGVIEKQGIKMVRYKISVGDNLSKLSKKYGVSTAELLKHNPDAEFGVKEGDVVLIPSKSPNSVSTEPANNKLVTLPANAKPMEVKTAPAMPVLSVVSGEEEESDEDSTFLSSVDSTFSHPDTTFERVLIIPFDPFKYFSDADDEIAQRSKLPRQEIRQLFRRRLSTLTAPDKYETVHLLGAEEPDSTRDLDKISASLFFRYDEPIISEKMRKQMEAEKAVKTKGVNGVKDWMNRAADRLTPPAPKPANAPKENRGLNKFEGKFYNVLIKDPKFFEYFNKKYRVKYYVFLNQFEVKTNYDNCIDRARQDYERNFTIHYSIYRNDGKQIAGNRAKIYYHSNSNSVMQIINDNSTKISKAVLFELP